MYSMWNTYKMYKPGLYRSVCKITHGQSYHGGSQSSKIFPPLGLSLLGRVGMKRGLWKVSKRNKLFKLYKVSKHFEIIEQNIFFKKAVCLQSTRSNMKQVSVFNLCWN